jgi:glycosyltransferase involved in cell wall biosynthesis
MKRTGTGDRAIRLALLHTSRPEWSAGVHYVKNLAIAIRSQREEVRVHLTLASLAPIAAEDLTELGPLFDETVTAAPTRWHVALSHYALLSSRYLGFVSVPEAPVSRVLRQRGVRALWVPGGEVGLRIPWMAWIPDFQHLRLPHFFTAEMREGRTRQYTTIAREARVVLLSSEDASADFRRLCPTWAHKAIVIPFVAQTPSGAYERDPSWVCQHYHIPQRFIYLPNQFWIHKNHLVVLEALTRTRQLRPDLTVVCTGNTNDYRAPQYFGQLLADIAERDLRQQLIVLGLVPHEHVYYLMRQSLVVLQPSLFEGWSTTVEEAKSMGKALLLSDIAVHREQAGSATRFFPAHDPEALARQLIEIHDEVSPGPDLLLESRARDQLPARTRAFGAAFLRAARAAMV